jgi:hypothetical protein
MAAIGDGAETDPLLRDGDAGPPRRNDAVHNNLICTLHRMITHNPPAAPNGGYARELPQRLDHAL